MEFLENLNKKNAPNEEAFNALLKKIDFLTDKDYIDFIKKHNGAGGFLSSESYILLWNIEDLIALNPYYKDEPQCMNYFFFGSDGSELGYAFDKQNNGIVSIDFLEIGNIKPEYIASSFISFVNKLSAT